MPAALPWCRTKSAVLLLTAALVLTRARPGRASECNVDGEQFNKRYTCKRCNLKTKTNSTAHCTNPKCPSFVQFYFKGMYEPPFIPVLSCQSCHTEFHGSDAVEKFSACCAHLRNPSGQSQQSSGKRAVKRSSKVPSNTKRAKKTTREAREARERRYRREIDDARRSLVEQKEMWLGLVKDSEQQCRDLELEVAAVTREEAALSSQLEDVRRNDDGAVEVLTGELVAMKLRAAELSNECDMLDHHATLVRRQAPQPR